MSHPSQCCITVGLTLCSAREEITHHQRVSFKSTETMPRVPALPPTDPYAELMECPRPTRANKDNAVGTVDHEDGKSWRGRSWHDQRHCLLLIPACSKRYVEGTHTPHTWIIIRSRCLRTGGHLMAYPKPSIPSQCARASHASVTNVPDKLSDTEGPALPRRHQHAVANLASIGIRLC